MGFFDLPTMADVAREQKAPSKGIPHQLVKQDEKKAAVKKDEAFRADIWKLDRGCSRATGKSLKKSGTTNWDELGEVDHSIPRSLAPDRIWDPSNALLLSKRENRLRKVACPEAPEYRMFSYSGPDNRRKPQHFIWRDRTGKIEKETRG